MPELASAAELGLRPAMSLLGRVANVKDVPAGEGISYGHEYVTGAPTRAALIPLGYADGVPWQAGNSGPVMLGGRRHRVAGRVCMDQVVLDLTRDHPDPGDVQAGDVAVLFGGQEGEPTAQDWAEAAGTISYEIVSRIGARVPRIYLGDPAAGPADG
jgi:alanine racemase